VSPCNGLRPQVLEALKLQVESLVKYFVFTYTEKVLFSGYIIEKRISTSKSWEKVITLEPSVTQFCITNLKEKSEYYFRVYAENAIGLSEPSETEAVQLKTHACKYLTDVEFKGKIRLFNWIDTFSSKIQFRIISKINS